MSLAQLSQLLPLPDDELQQVLDYASTLSKPEAVSHFSNLLGDSPLAIDFISSFNSRRGDSKPAKPAQPGLSATPGPSSSSEAIDAVPKSMRKPQKKKKVNIHELAPRKVQDFAAPSGTVYTKKNLGDLDYIPQSQRTPSAPGSNDVSRSTTPNPAPAQKPPPAPKQAPQRESKAHASSGYLISDGPPKAKGKPNLKVSGGATKVAISGGTPMAGQSTALNDLDAAIRALEITTNPTLDNPKARKCNCVATRHPLQSAAPNCLSCGKVICMKEGLGPCTFCGTPLLKKDDVEAMMRELKDERAKERMAADARANRKADVSKTPAPFSGNKARGAYVSTDPTLAEAEAKAKEHRDKLLGFQAQNARRTTVRDEASDFDVSGAVSGSGGSMWASPEERARELKRQQKILREMEWNARPDYEKRQQVLSIDLVGGKVVRKMAAVERPVTPESEDDTTGVLTSATGNGGARSGGAFSGNPLLGSLIKPVFDAKGKGPEAEGASRSRKTGWRRVQDDLDNNENVILDGGIRGYEQEASDERKGS